MSAHAYTEDQLVEQPAMRLLGDLGWSLAQPHPHLGPLPQGEEAPAWIDETGLLGRETKGEVVLVPRLRAALEKLNPSLPPEAITAAVDELTRDRSAMGLPAANREIYALIKDGIRVSIAQPEDSPSPQPSPKGRGSAGAKRSPLPLGEGSGGEGRGGDGSRRDSGGQRTERVRVIDWENPAANDFLLVSQFSVTGALYTCRPDLVGFVNGLPLVVIELKKPGVPARGVRRKPDALQGGDFAALLVQRPAHRLERHGQPRRLAHGGLGAVLRVEAHRARGRAAPGVAGSDAARNVRPVAAA